MTGSFRDYTAYGLHFRSALVLPFSPLSDPPTGAADVSIRYGPTPTALPRPLATRMMHPIERGLLWEAAPGAFLIHVPGLARYFVTAGRDIVIEPCVGSDRNAVSTFLTGTVLAALLQQRELVPLHASAVATGTGAVLFAGWSGQGKSSLLAALIERGYVAMSDDVTAVEMDAAGKPRALAAFPSMRLWRDTLDMLCWRGRTRVQEGMEKYLIPIKSFSPAPLPVRAVFFLTQSDRSDIAVRPMSSAKAFRALRKFTYRKAYLKGLGAGTTHFRTLAAMAKSVPVFRVIRPAYPFLLDALADRIDAHLRGEAPFAGEDAAAGPAASSAVAAGG